MNSQLMIRTCAHMLPEGRRCLGAAVRGRACCRHHLDSRTRLHNMARARRLTSIPRMRVPESPRDLALNRAEVSRVLATERIDPDTALMMLWALDLTAVTLRADFASSSKRAAKVNRMYQVPLTPSVARIYPQNLPQVLENTSPGGEGVTLSGCGPLEAKVREGTCEWKPAAPEGRKSKPSGF